MAWHGNGPTMATAAAGSPLKKTLGTERCPVICWSAVCDPIKIETSHTYNKKIRERETNKQRTRVAAVGEGATSGATLRPVWYRRLPGEAPNASAWVGMLRVRTGRGRGCRAGGRVRAKGGRWGRSRTCMSWPSARLSSSTTTSGMPLPHIAFFVLRQYGQNDWDWNDKSSCGINSNEIEASPSQSGPRLGPGAWARG